MQTAVLSCCVLFMNLGIQFYDGYDGHDRQTDTTNCLTSRIQECAGDVAGFTYLGHVGLFTAESISSFHQLLVDKDVLRTSSVPQLHSQHTPHLRVHLQQGDQRSEVRGQKFKHYTNNLSHCT